MFSCVNGVLLRRDQIVMPKKLQKEMLDKTHEGHLGAAKSKARAREHMWWQGMNAASARMFTMATSECESVVVCSVLCFIQNKMSYLPVEKLGEVVTRGFGENEVGQAKDLMFEVAANFLELKGFRKKVRKNTGHKRKVEAGVEGILELCYAADGSNIGIPRFVAVDINSLHHIPLEEVDGSLVFDKVLPSFSGEAEGVLKGIEEAQAMSSDSALATFGKLSSDMAEEFGGEIKKLSRELEGLREKLLEVNALVEVCAMKTGQRKIIRGGEKQKDMSQFSPSKEESSKANKSGSDERMVYAKAVKLGTKAKGVDDGTHESESNAQSVNEDGTQRRGIFSSIGS